MCRLLYVRSERPFAVVEHLRPFAALSRASKEYQGHGWGCALLRDGGWWRHRDLRPIWEDDLTRFGTTRLMLAHARSAFQDRGIVIDNNMPFTDDRYAFVFNGELRGVRLQAEGRIGAEKVFNFIKRFDRGDMLAALRRAIPIIIGRTEYVRALNLIVTDTDGAWVSTTFNEDPDYFTLRERREAGTLAVCSEPYPGDSGWRPIPGGTTGVLRC